MRRRQALAAWASLVAPTLPLKMALADTLGAARTWHVARGDRLDEAIAAAAEGDIVELEPGHHHGQAAVILQRRLTVRAEGGGTAVLHADGAHAEGKALLVVRDGDVHVEGLEFRGTRVPDGNGAGIRFERGTLTLRRCRFFDNEMGLLSSNLPGGRLTIEHCEFGQAPRHGTVLHHLLYVGRMQQLTLRHSRFSGGWRGHLVKSRAQRNLILCNVLDDGPTGEASYEIDLPNGGQAWVQGNLVVQGERSQNDALLAYGAEGQLHPGGELTVAHNVLVNTSARSAAFVKLWPEHLLEPVPVHIRHNRCHGLALARSWGRPDQGNRLLPLADWQRAPFPPPCPPEPAA